MSRIVTGETPAERLRGGRGSGSGAGEREDRSISGYGHSRGSVDGGGGKAGADVESSRAGADAGRGAGLSLVDTHCHLDAEHFEGEPVAAILARARKTGVERVVTIATDVESSRRAVRLATFNQGVWATVGIDPNDLAGWTASGLGELEQLAGAPRVVAVGEIGLDYHWMRSPREDQIKAFEAQLDLASRVGLPVVIHSRDADADMERILIRWAADHPPVDRPLGVMHCYGGSAGLAQRLFEAGFLISLCGTVTFKNAHDAHAVARTLPERALVLETDSPYLTPHPHRGTRNEPAHVRIVAEAVAGLRGTTLEAVAAFTSENAERLFGLTDGGHERERGRDGEVTA